MEEQASNGVPQFATAEYAASAGAGPCNACGKPVGHSHYRVNGAVVCEECTRQLREQMPADSHAVFVRGVAFGIGGALLGLAIYVAFALATGWIIGYVSLAVGFIVGKAMMMGSGGRGGRRYQVAALLLTYFAVSLAAVPIAISHQLRQKSEQQMPASDTASVTKPPVEIGKAVAVLVLMGLASPFLSLSDPAQGIIGLVILFVGLRIAWKLTAGRVLNIVGPIEEAAPTPSP